MPSCVSGRTQWRLVLHAGGLSLTGTFAFCVRNRVVKSEQGWEMFSSTFVETRALKSSAQRTSNTDHSFPSGSANQTGPSRSVFRSPHAPFNGSFAI